MKKKITALLLAGLMSCSLVLGGCSSNGKKDDTSSADSQTAQASTSENELRVAIASQIATLDPGLNSTTHLSQIIRNTSMTLFQTQEDGTYANMLCKDYTVSDDGLTYTFTLQSGIKWSDGKELKADDFVYTLKRVIGYGPDNTYVAQNFVNFIKGATAANEAMMDVADMKDVGIYSKDDYTFVIELENPCPYFLKVLGGMASTPVRADFAKEHESTWSLTPGYPALGAFVLDSVNANESAVYVKNENYAHADDVQLDKLTFLVMPDENAQLSAFKSGQVDIAMAVPSATASNKEYDKNFFKLDSYTSTYFIALNSGAKGPEALKDVKVRKALALAIDKSTLIKVLNSGVYLTELDGYIPYGFQGENGDFRKEGGNYLEYDPDQAKSLLAEAGYTESNPLKLEYLYSNSQFHGDVAQMLQQLWSAIGVQVELKAVEMGVFYDYVDNGDFQMSRYAISDSSDPLNFLKNWATDSQIEPAVSDPTYDAMVKDALSCTDAAEYPKKLHALEDYLIGENAYLIPLFTQESVTLVQTNVKGVWANPGGSFFFDKVTVA